MIVQGSVKSALSGKLQEKLSGDKLAPAIICRVYCIIPLVGQMFKMQFREGIEISRCRFIGCSWQARSWQSP